jgi:KDO2-lipid IV(A) lauroyltransferase
MRRENLSQSGICRDAKEFRRIFRQSIGESGKAILETFAIWQRHEHGLISWVRQCDGWNDVEAALAQGKGIIFLTPHLGCFEITSLYYSAHHPITVLYRPPKQEWLLPFMLRGRTRGNVRLAPATTKGVRDLLHALKQKEAIGILPDQIPAQGEGEWAPYFGRQAYTMTLASRLANKTGAAIFMVFGERLPLGAGYHLHFTRLPDGCINSVTGLNEAIEAQVRQCPAQYLWTYNRHKIRHHAKDRLPDSP